MLRTTLSSLPKPFPLSALPKPSFPLSSFPKRTLLTHSSISGPSSPPLSPLTLPAFWRSQILSKHSARPALVCRAERPGVHGGPGSVERNTEWNMGVVSLNTGRNMGREGYLAWDFEEMGRHVDALARGLIAMGVKRGERVGVIMGNTSAYAMLQWACASIGAVLVTINPAYRAHELISALTLTSTSHLILVPHLRTSRYLHMLASALPDLCSAHQRQGEVSVEGVSSLRSVVVVHSDHNNDNEVGGSIGGSTGGKTRKTSEELEKLGLERAVIDWREVMIWDEAAGEGRVQREIEAGLGRDDVVNLQFTSGTTGAPKAVSLTHANLLNNALQIGRCMRFTEGDLLCNVPPLFHCFGLVLGNLAAWTHGAGVVYAAPTFEPGRVVDAVVEEKCTALHGVPTHFLGVLEEVRRRRARGEGVDVSRLRTGIGAGTPIPIDLMTTLQTELNLTELTIAYGMTETSPVSFQTTPADPLLKRVETVGRVHPHVRAKVVDAEGRVVEVGTPGELVVAGYLVQKGYWEDEEHTRAAMKRDEEGTVWMYTGDEAVMDAEGYLKIVGRVKDLIIRGGENLFPVQIENTLTAHPAIREAAAIAVPDAKYGEVVGVWVVREPQVDGNSSVPGGVGGAEHETPRLTGGQVRELVARGMNPQNAPAWVWFVGEDGAPEDLPKTASGKVQKHVLREWGRGLCARGVGRVSGTSSSS